MKINPKGFPTAIIATVRAQIRNLRAEEGLQRLRSGKSRISLSKGDLDDVDSLVDDLLRNADHILTEAVRTEATDTPEEHTAQLAKVDLAINQAGEMIEEAKTETAA